MTNISYIKSFSVFLFLIILLFPVSLSASDSSCKIKDSTAEVLQDYFVDADTVMKNVKASVNKEDDSSVKKKVTWEALRIFNSLPSWKNYFSTFDYYVKLLFTSEIPSEVKRDYNKIEEEIEDISDFLESVLSDWKSRVKVEKPCDWVSSKCELSWNAGDVLWKLLANTEAILRLYRLSIMDRRPEFEWNLILVNDNFIEEFWNYYNWFTLTDCSDSEGWFLEKVKESINKIWDKSKWWFDWIKEWKEAWAMLVWTYDKEAYKERERELLKEELSRQWVSSYGSDAIEWNLEKYNWKSWVTWPEYLTRSFETIKQRVKEQVDEFDNAVLQSTSSDSSSDSSDMISIKDFDNTIDKNSVSNDIWKNVAEVFEKSIPSASLQDTWSEKIMQKIIDMHISLSQAIDTLEKIAVLSRKVCNEQDSWNWNCD